MNFIAYDLIALAAFVIFISVFLYVRRKRVSREGPLFLYKTQVGVNVLEYISTRFRGFLKILAYPIVAIGYALMGFVVWIFVKSTYEYVVNPTIVEVIKAPPLMILFPYFTRVFGVQGFFPGEFYFLYFILSIAVIAVIHEGFHGIYARLHKVKVKSTGFGFLGPLLAFFVELDEKQMQKKKIFPQLSVTAAGVFGDIVAALIFFGLIILLFNNAYMPYGVEFNSYSISQISISDAINAQITNETIQLGGEEFTRIIIENKSYLVTQKFFDINLEELDKNAAILIYQDQPAIRAELNGVITKIDENQVTSIKSLEEALNSHKIGEKVQVWTEDELGKETRSEIVLGESYETKSKPVLGIIIGPKNSLKIFGLIELAYKHTGVAYKPTSNPEFIEFMYNLFAWIIFLNALMAIFNMLPVGIFDGGRFFYLTILAITKKEKIAKSAFKIATYFILLLVFVIMASWAIKRYM